MAQSLNKFMFNTENTTHEEAVRLLNERLSKEVDLYNTISSYQKMESVSIRDKAAANRLLYDLYNDVIQGEIAQQLRQNPFSFPSVKAVNKFIDQ